MNDETVEAVTKNWDLFQNKAKLVMSKDKTKQGLATLLEELEEDDDAEGLICPASTRREYMGCYPGGLVEHSLRVLGYMGKLLQAYNVTNVKVDSVVFVALFHDIGKTGVIINDTRIPYYIKQESDWHRNKLGQMYEVNPVLSHFSPSQLSLQILASHGIVPSLDEWYAIASVKADKLDESIPVNNEPMLSLLLKQAIRVASLDTKNQSTAKSISSK